jgi:dTMP kinase
MPEPTIMASRNKKRKGIFITLEGMEAVGKTTAMEYVVDWAKRYGLTIVSTKEPGGTPVGLAIRELFLSDLKEQFNPMTELCLLFATKAQLLADIILPALSDGCVVITDRYTDTLFAYQGGGQRIPAPLIERLERATLSDVVPDCTILLDVSLKESLKRIRARPHAENNIMDFQPDIYYQRVRRVFKARAKDNPRYLTVDGEQSREIIREQIFTMLDQQLYDRLPDLTDDTHEYTQRVTPGKSIIYTAVSNPI